MKSIANTNVASGKSEVVRDNAKKSAALTHCAQRESTSKEGKCRRVIMSNRVAQGSNARVGSCDRRSTKVQMHCRERRKNAQLGARIANKSKNKLPLATDQSSKIHCAMGTRDVRRPSRNLKRLDP